MTLNLLFDHFDQLITQPEDIPRLNGAILQLAVQGKLLPQDPADEPASELLKRIRAEKDRLLLTGQLSRDTSLPPIGKDEIPYELPESWVWVRLGDLCHTITKGSSPKWQGVNYVDKNNGILFITSKNVGQYELILDEETYVEPKFNEIEPRSILCRNDILMNIVGASIGRTAIYRLDKNANINQAVCLIRLIDHQNLCSEYLLHFFNSSICVGYMFDKQVDNARANLSMGNIAKFPIPLPPLAEQKRIVAKVESLLAQTRVLVAELAAAKQERAQLNRASLHHLLAALTPTDFISRWRFLATHFDVVTPDSASVDELKRAILQLAVHGKLVLQDPADEPASELLKRIRVEKKWLVKEGKIKDEIPFELPEGWEWVTVEQIGEVIGGLTKNSTRNNFPLKMPYLRVANVYANELRLNDVQEIGVQEDEIKRVSLSKGDLLVVEGNGSIEQIGRVAIWDGSITPCLHQNHLIKVRFKVIEVSEYIVYWFLSSGGREQITRVASTTTGLHTLSLSKVSALPIPLPPLAEQKRIVAKVECLLKLCDELKVGLVAGEAVRVRLLESLLHQAVNGVSVSQ